jgi:hypothetical protein
VKYGQVQRPLYAISRKKTKKQENHAKPFNRTGKKDDILEYAGNSSFPGMRKGILHQNLTG